MWCCRRVLLQPSRNLAQLLKVPHEPSTTAVQSRLFSALDSSSQAFGRRFRFRSLPQYDSRRCLHPALLLVVQKLAKGLALVTGRSIRNWWRTLPPGKREYFQQRIRENRKKIAVGAAASAALAGGYYVSHLQPTPITGRTRFIVFTQDQILKLMEADLEKSLHSLKAVSYPTGHPFVGRVTTVARRLLNANIDLDEVHSKQWTISVLDSPEKNAQVLPNGHIFVNRGMLMFCDTDDELGCVLAHEMAHALLNHAAEQLSHAHLLDLLGIVVVAAIWAVLPTDVFASLIHWLFNRSTALISQLPHSRLLEAEADAVGLELAAKACFDVRSSSAFWAKMSLVHELGYEPEIPEFLSTHPSHDSRSRDLDDKMPQAIMRRVECRCPPLPRIDPRMSLEAFRLQVTAAKKLHERTMADQQHAVRIVIPR